MTFHDSKERASQLGLPTTNELLRLIFESAHDFAILSMDPHGLVTSWNSGAERLIGWRADEIVGKSVDIIFTPEDQAAGVSKQERMIAAKTARAADDRWHRRKDGGRFWASGLMMPLEDAQRGFVKILRDRTEQHLMEERLRASEERQKVLIAELKHRTGNLLTLTLGIAAQTLRRVSTLEEFGQEFQRRIHALARVQVLTSDYANVDLRRMVTNELEAYDSRFTDGRRARVEGPELRLWPEAAQILGLALHELTTNAAKHGAFAVDNGGLRVHWTIEERENKPWVVLVWKETGVPLPAQVPARRGYGRELIEHALQYQLGAETQLMFEPDGARCTIAVPLERTDLRDGEGQLMKPATKPCRGLGHCPEY
jgi:PAS domain S-box-containing protein